MIIKQFIHYHYDHINVDIYATRLCEQFLPFDTNKQYTMQQAKINFVPWPWTFSNIEDILIPILENS